MMGFAAAAARDDVRSMHDYEMMTDYERMTSQPQHLEVHQDRGPVMKIVDEHDGEMTLSQPQHHA
eukprot:654400-Rhodomonas_salina.1